VTRYQFSTGGLHPHLFPLLLVAGLSLSCASNEMMEPRFQGLENRIQQTESAADSLQDYVATKSISIEAALSNLQVKLETADTKILESLRADTADALSKVDRAAATERALLALRGDSLSKRQDDAHLSLEALRGSVRAQVGVLTQQVSLTGQSLVDARADEAGKLERILKAQDQEKLEDAASRSHINERFAGAVTREWVENRLAATKRQAVITAEVKVEEATAWSKGDTGILTLGFSALMTAVIALLKQKKAEA